MPEIIIKAGRSRDKKKRNMHPASLANLTPLKPGDPPLNKEGGQRRRTYTDRYEITGNSVTPEPVRIILNMKLKLQLLQILDLSKSRQLLDADGIKALEAQIKNDLIPKGTIWAEAQSIRMHLSAVLEGDVNAATEVRESVEGRSTQRIEFPNSNNRLEQLLDEFRMARANPPAAPEPASKT